MNTIVRVEAITKAAAQAERHVAALCPCVACQVKRSRDGVVPESDRYGGGEQRAALPVSTYLGGCLDA